MCGVLIQSEPRKRVLTLATYGIVISCSYHTPLLSLLLGLSHIPYHTIPYHTIPYHTIPYHTIPYHTVHARVTLKFDLQQ